jgi:hypothetical protein
MSIPASINGKPVTGIGNGAFMNCSGLTSVTIPASVTTFWTNAFYNCSGLTSITVDAANPSFSSENGVLFNKQKTVLLQHPGAKAGAYTIPGTVTSIGDNGFYGCSNLTGVTIPSSVTSIGGGAFYGCSALAGVTIPSSMTTIGDWAFGNCSGLMDVTIPTSVTGIGSRAFSGCSKLAVAEFSGNAPTMGSDVFSSVESGFTVKYHSGNIGFTSPTWLGYPSVMLPPATRIVSLAGNLAFGNVISGFSATSTLTISNSGNWPLTVSSIMYPSGFSGNWSSGTIAAGSSQSVTVTFSPTAMQSYGGTITVNSDSTSGTGTFSASGQGTAPPSPYATWRGSKFTAADILSGLTTMTDDFDHDSVANILEYAFGMNPKVADATGIAPNVSGNKLQISFSCDATRTDITYTVQSSTTLAPNSWADIARSVGGAATIPIGSLSTVSDSSTGLRTVTVTDSTAISGGKRFLRVKVTSP